MRTITRTFRAAIARFQQRSLAWKGLFFTIIGVFIALGAWLVPEPFTHTPVPQQEPTTVAQSLGITEQISPRNPDTVRILVATFDEADQNSYRVTELILTRLRSALSAYPDTEVIATSHVITEKDGGETAIKIGEIYDANIVIWGWYGLTTEVVPLGVHFETISYSGLTDESIPGVCSAVSASQIKKASASDLNNLTLQTNLSNELASLSIFTIGLARFEANDWKGAIEMMSDAVEQIDQNTVISAKTFDNESLVDFDLLYFYRALAYYNEADIDSAIDDLEKISGSMESDSGFQLLLGQFYVAAEKFEDAISHLDRAIGKKPDNSLLALSHYLRGVSYNSLSLFDSANQDFKIAFDLDSEVVYSYMLHNIPPDNVVSHTTELISKNSNHFVAYYSRGLAKKTLGESFDALADFNKALEIYPEFLIARQSRMEMVRDNEEGVFDAILAKQDHEILLASDEYRTPCNLLSAGNFYYELGENDKSEQYFDEAVLTASAENVPAHFVKGVALLRLGKKIQAYREFNKARQLSPTDEYRTKIDSNINYIRGTYIGMAVLLTVILIAIAWVVLIVVPLAKNKSLHHRHLRRY